MIPTRRAWEKLMAVVRRRGRAIDRAVCPHCGCVEGSGELYWMRVGGELMCETCGKQRVEVIRLSINQHGSEDFIPLAEVPDDALIGEYMETDRGVYMFIKQHGAVIKGVGPFEHRKDAQEAFRLFTEHWRRRHGHEEVDDSFS